MDLTVPGVTMPKVQRQYTTIQKCEKIPPFDKLAGCIYARHRQLSTARGRTFTKSTVLALVRKLMAFSRSYAL